MPARVPSGGPSPARIMIIGEAPGATEEVLGKPFVGSSGNLLDGMLSSAGISRRECFVTNVCKYRPPRNDITAWLTDKKAAAKRGGLTHTKGGRFYNDLVAEGLEELQEEIAAVQPQVIIGLGNAPLWALTDAWGIKAWRGSELQYNNIPFIPTYHPAYILRAWGEKSIMLHDLRTRVVAKMGRPETHATPPWRFVSNPTTEEAVDALAQLWGRLEGGPTWLACDTETRFCQITCVGFAWSNLDALCIPMMHVDGARWWDEETENRLRTHIRSILMHPNVRLIGQNFNYDRQYFDADKPFGYAPQCAFDTHIAQHLLLPGTPKDLAYLSSLYCDWHSYWKDEGQAIASAEDELRWWWYNCRDTIATYEVAMKQMPALQRLGWINT